MATIAQGRSSRRRPLGMIGYAFFLFVVVAIGSLAGWIGKSGIMSHVFWEKLGLAKSARETFGKGSINLLILGCDEDRTWTGYKQSKISKAGVRSDMMLITRLDFDKKSITGISIPRDMQCTVEGVTHKINAFHAIGGPDLAKQAVEKLVGVPIDRVVVLDFVAFEKLVDLTGGVDVDVDKDLNYDDFAGNLHIHIPKGRHHLTGEQAMGFVRFRHSDDDFHRQARQKLFMLAFKQSVFNHPTNLPAVTQQAALVLGGAMTDDEIGSLANFAQGIPATGIKMGVVPAVNPDANPMRLDRRALQKVLAEFGFPAQDDSRVTASR